MSDGQVDPTAVERTQVPQRLSEGKVEDNWANRSLGMVCETCMFYVPKQDGLRGLQEQPKGRCRRHAPTMSGFPVVFPRDWCGDHKLK